MGRFEVQGGNGAVTRRVRVATIAVVVVPVWVAVLRFGLRGLYPSGDAATTVLRARDVFTGPFPLAGMPAAGATGQGLQAYFPGAWQLYVIAVPTRLFGVVWGPLVAMALLNTLWLALACWLVFRRLRAPEAFVAVALLGVFVWALGGGFLVTPIPMDMVMVPLVTFLVAVWVVADGDVAALPVLALVGNFLWLDHLVLVILVPILGVAGVVGFWQSHRNRIRRDPDRTAGERPTLRRHVGLAAAVTVVMWIPTVVQQLTSNPGNLRVLATRSDLGTRTIGSWTTALHFVVSFVTMPPFWLRSSFGTPTIVRHQVGAGAIGGLSVYDLITGLLLVAVVVGLAWSAFHRGDRSGLLLLGVAGLALVVAVVTTYFAPLVYFPPSGYVRSLWSVAMFTWLAVFVNVVRSIGPVRPRLVTVPAVALLVVVTVLSVPAPPHGYGSDPVSERVVAAVNAAVVPRVAGSGPVRLPVNRSLATQHYAAPLTLALEDAGVRTCVPRREYLSDGSRSVCPADVRQAIDLRIVTGSSERSDPAAGAVVSEEPMLTDAERAELARLEGAIDRWAASSSRLELTPEADRRLHRWLAPSQQVVLEHLLALRGPEVAGVRTDASFSAMVVSWYQFWGSRMRSTPLFVDSPLSADEWDRWVELSRTDRHLRVVVRDLQPHAAGTPGRGGPGS